MHYLKPLYTAAEMKEAEAGHDVDVLMGRAAGAVEGGGVIDTTFGQPQQPHDQQDRATDQQHFVPAALMGQQHGARCRQCLHTWGSYGLG